MTSRLPSLAIAAFILLGQMQLAQATTVCTLSACPPGQSLNEECECASDPVPELSTMAIPAALGLAGYFALRARKKASKEE